MQRQSIERQAWQYWYDPLDLVRTVLLATHLRAENVLWNGSICR